MTLSVLQKVIEHLLYTVHMDFGVIINGLATAAFPCPS